MVTSLLHRVVEGPVADDRTYAFPVILLLLSGRVSWGVAAVGQGVAGAGPGRDPPPAAPALAPFPVPGRSSLFALLQVASHCWSLRLSCLRVLPG